MWLWRWLCCVFALAVLAKEEEKVVVQGTFHAAEETSTTTWTDRTTEQPRNIPPAWLDAAWHATSWSDCTPCSYGHVQIRQVQCFSIFEMAVLSEDHCSNTGKPPLTQTCSCDEISCSSKTELCPAKKAEWFEPESPYTELGCYYLHSSHNVSHGHREGGSDYRDLSCLKHKGNGPCKSGLPFYSMTSNAMSPSLCFSFCTSKGLDIFGLVKGEECRCGFSAINRNARMRGPMETDLQFMASRLEPYTSVKGVCPLRVFRYSGYFEAGGLPPSLVKLTDVDVMYFRQVLHQWTHEPPENDVWFFTHAPTTPKPGGPAKVDLTHGHKKNGGELPWERSCYPDNCGPGGGPWPKREPYAPRGVFDQFQLYCPIPYIFTEGIDAARKEVFRNAVRIWHELTCVVLIEHEPEELTETMGPYIEVRVDKPDKCYATKIGYPGYWNGKPDRAVINLGWCNNMYSLGSVVHEIGHVIGMNHEQKRTDATERVNGHGPYLKIFWHTMLTDSSKHQYLPDHRSYMGSDSQGQGDVHEGYASYDYGSIMHYGRTGKFEPLEKRNVELLGNRDHLSESDILQINDMYQCKELDATPVDMDCDFEEDPGLRLCNWVNVGQDSSKWLQQCVSSSELGSGPDTVPESGDCYLYAEATDHPWEVFILESPALSTFRDYVLTFSYYLTSKASKLAVHYESVTGKSVEIFRDISGKAEEWIYKEVDVFGDEAVTVRFVVTTTDLSDSGAAIDHVKLLPRGHLAHGSAHSDKPQESLLEQAVDAFNNLLDVIFSRKYESEHRLRHGKRAEGRTLRWASPWSERPLQALSLVVALLTLSALVFAFTRQRFRSLMIQEHEEHPEETVPLSARECITSQLI